MIRTTTRTARKLARCGCGCGNTIRPGDRYLEHVLTPGEPDGLGPLKWARTHECAGCAARYGRPIGGAA